MSEKQVAEPGEPESSAGTNASARRKSTSALKATLPFVSAGTRTRGGDISSQSIAESDADKELIEKHLIGVIPFGEFLIERGHITATELEAVLAIQAERNPKLGSLARKHQLLSHSAVCAIVQHMSQTRSKFGNAAIELGLLNETEVKALLAEQLAGHIRLGELIAEIGMMKITTVMECLEQYRQIINGKSIDP